MRKPRRRSKLTAVRSVVPKVLDELGLDEARVAYEIGQRWSEIVGDEAALHSRPMLVRRGVLEAEVDSSVWCQQLQLRRIAVVATMREVLGDQSPRDLRFRVGSLRYHVPNE